MEEGKLKILEPRSAEEGFTRTDTELSKEELPNWGWLAPQALRVCVCGGGGCRVRVLRRGTAQMVKHL